MTRLERIILECQRHSRRIKITSKELSEIMPLRSTTYVDLSDDHVGTIDQFLYRFTNLQDAIGVRLFPALLEALGEEVKTATFLDRLNRMEELGLLEAAKWGELREIRNNIAHDYSVDPEVASQSINMVFERYEQLISIFERIENLCRTRELI